MAKVVILKFKDRMTPQVNFFHTRELAAPSAHARSTCVRWIQSYMQRKVAAKGQIECPETEVALEMATWQM